LNDEKTPVMVFYLQNAVGSIKLQMLRNLLNKDTLLRGGYEMLVLSRKPGERIHIGDDITVTVLEINGRLVRIGVEAPRQIGIFRAEIKDQIERENKLAAEKTGYIGRLKDIRSFLGVRKRIDS